MPFYGPTVSELVYFTQRLCLSRGIEVCVNGYLSGETTAGNKVLCLNMLLSSERITILTGWWFGTCFIFPYIGNGHPNWLIFFRGFETTNQ